VNLPFGAETEPLCFANSLRKVFRVDLLGCKDIEFQTPDDSDWTIIMPFSLSFSMPKDIADSLSDDDIMDRVDAQLERLLDEDSPLFRGAFGVEVTGMSRHPERDEGETE
jgi:hypothetical protein